MGRRGRGTGGRRAAAHRWDALFPPDDAPPGLLDIGPPGHGAGLAERGDPAHHAGLADDSGDAGDTRPADDPGDGEDTGLADGTGYGYADGSGVRRRADRPRFAVSVRLGAVLAALLAAVCAGWWAIAYGAAPTAAPVDASPVRTGSAGPQAPGHQTSSGSPAQPPVDGPTVDGPVVGGPTVHVAGAVAAPGVYRLAPGARVHEAIAAAGGAKPGADLDRLNLAAPVEDGTRLKVPVRGEPEEGLHAGGTAAGAPGGSAPQRADGTPAPAGGGPRKVNINTATAEDLGVLPRVGPVLAQRIVDYRAAHGRFSAPEDLDAVSGIGPKMLESLLPLVTVG
ncbi:ComEA family DNA-binding protein [Sinomonas atrocyanea]|uniref:ComEA family DNA-binding protein n=1 Tax=Sinomonas atrocyanea TaxID=37927 RepID=UPI00285B60A2|nr:ComEA family DNA-binding protein [Sinomonas atrocyanea]MDR6619778.1 competence protein ComEA [Sinomonas atrocyanea]